MPHALMMKYFSNIIRIFLIQQKNIKIKVCYYSVVDCYRFWNEKGFKLISV